MNETNKRTWMDLEGFWQPHDWADYEHLANEVSDHGLLIEVGSFRGKSLCSIAETIKRKQLQVISIDPFGKVPNPNYVEPEVENRNEGMLSDFYNNIDEFGIVSRVNTIVKLSTDGAREIENSSLRPDMVFIDGDHSYEAVCADIDAWWPLIKEGGIIAFHDYCHNGFQWPGVHKAIHEKMGPPAFGVYIAAFKKINGRPVPQVGQWKDPRFLISKTQS